jgi:hypothetical protein
MGSMFGSAPSSRRALRPSANLSKRARISSRQMGHREQFAKTYILRQAQSSGSQNSRGEGEPGSPRPDDPPGDARVVFCGETGPDRAAQWPQAGWTARRDQHRRLVPARCDTVEHVPPLEQRLAPGCRRGRRGNTKLVSDAPFPGAKLKTRRSSKQGSCTTIDQTQPDIDWQPLIRYAIPNGL